MMSSHQPLIDLLNQLKKTSIALAEISDEKSKELIKRMNPDDAKKYEQVVSEMKEHIDTADKMNIHAIVSEAKEKINNMNKR